MIDDKVLDMIINERLECLDEIDPATMATIGAIYTITGLSYMVSNIYNSLLSKMARACSAYSGAAKTICNLKFKMQAAQAALNKSRESKTKCLKTKDPDKCNQKFDDIIQRFQTEIKEYNDQLRDLRNYNIT
jgi:hypothetical protein